MNFLLTLLIFIIMLGIIVFIHELGHFIAAKKSGVYVSEFALGMGPVLKRWKRKGDETEYTIRAFPIGGFCAMASDADPDLEVSKDRTLESKSFIKRFLVLIMGIVLNCVLAIILLFINGLIYGSPKTEAMIGGVREETPAYSSGLQKGDVITKIDGKTVHSWDDVLLEISVKELRETYTFTVARNGKSYDYKISPIVGKNEKNEETRTFGIGADVSKERGFISALKYSIKGFDSMIKSLFRILGNIFSGGIGLNSLSGPIGVFTVVDTVKENGFENIIYLTAYLSMNVGIINLLPVPVFDGGRILLLVIEKIKRKKINPKVETVLNYAGFGLMILLMLYVTFSDIIKLF